jgi:pyruvate dehydrogenase E2 component (dihydrolipoamide acetyltransferase)
LIAIIGDADEDISGLFGEGAVGRIETEKTIATPVQQSIAKGETATIVSEVKPAVLGEDGRIKISPLARRMASEHNVDLAMVEGSGPEGRIVKRDIEEYIEHFETQRVAKQKEAQPVTPTAVAADDFEDVSLSMMRKAIARRMVESKTTAPHFYVTSEIDMKKAIEFRNALNALPDVKISYNDIVVKAVAFALTKHTRVNASWLGDRIRMNKSIHIGIAVALDDGLITPVIRNCDAKSLGQVSKESKDLAVRARERKLAPEEYSGSTFTISNLGMFDVENFAAIINPPEAAILAVSSIIEKPVVEHGQIVTGQRMKMTLSCDHRVIDGAVGAQFLQTVKLTLENPASLAL